MNEIQEIAKKTPASRAMFEYISNKRRNSKYLDLRRLANFFRLDDPTVTFDDMLATAEELARHGYGHIVRERFILAKPMESLSLKPWPKETRKGKPRRRYRPASGVIRTSHSSRRATPPPVGGQVNVIIGNFRMEIPAEKAQELFSALRKMI